MLLMPYERHHNHLIALEGIDGAGKSEQASRLAERLRQDMPDAEIVTVREPGSTAGGEAIRSLLHEQHRQLHPVTELFLFNAARCQLVEEVILPALKRGAIVIADRYVASSWAYQGVDITGPAVAHRLIDSDSIHTAIREICQYATNGVLYQGVTILLTCDDDEVENFVARQNSDIIRHPDYLLDVQKRYRDMADQERNWHEAYAGPRRTMDEIATIALQHLASTRERNL